MISTGSPQVRRAVATTVGNDRARLLAPNKMTRRVGCNGSVSIVRSPLCVDQLSAATDNGQRTADYRSPPMVAIRLQRLITAVGQEAEHQAREKCFADRQRIHGHQHGRADRQLQRLNDPLPRIAEREQLAGDLPAVQRVDRQQIDQPPQNIDLQQIAESARSAVAMRTARSRRRTAP